MIVEYFDKSKYTDKELVVKIASLSYDKEYNDNPDRLVKFLIEQGHHSVFEFLHKQHIFYIEVPIFVARQIMRHRCFSFLEKSLRYTDNFEMTTYRINNRYIKTINNFYGIVETMYEALRKEHKKEVARQVLPLATTTKMYMGGDLLCLINFFIYRLDSHAQFETRKVAEKMLEQLLKFVSVETMSEYIDYWLQNKLNTIRTFADIFEYDVEKDKIYKLVQNFINKINSHGIK